MITTDELKKLIETKGKYILIDVRELEELHYGVIPTSHNIPLGEVDEALKLDSESFEKKYGFKISKEDNIIFYCRTGNRSAEAAQIAKEKGYNAKNYPGSVKGWSQTDPNVKMYGPTF